MNDLPSGSEEITKYSHLSCGESHAKSSPGFPGKHSNDHAKYAANIEQ